MQHYRGLGFPVYTIGASIHKNRVPGLSAGSIYLGYELPLVILPLFALFLLKGVNPQTRKLLPVFMLITVAALYFTYTRSGMYALVPGVLVMWVFLKGKVKKTLFIIFLVMATAFLLYTNIVGTRYSRGFTEDASAAGRLVLWRVGAMIALDNPVFGIGQGRFIDISRYYYSEVESSGLSDELGIGSLGVEQTHNDFIRVWASYGTPALLVYLWLYIVIFKNFYYGYRRSSSPFIKALAFGGCGALMAYAVNAFSHNVMDSTQLFWIIAGFSLAISKLVNTQKNAKKDQITENAPLINLLPDSSPTKP